MAPQSLEETYVIVFDPADALDAIYPSYIGDFPPLEQKPLALLRELLKRGHYRLITARRRDNGACVAYMMGYPVAEGRCFWLDFFAVAPALRGLGLGAWVIEQLPKLFAVDGLFLEVEWPVQGHLDEKFQIRRIGFYERLGAFPLPVEYALLQEDGRLFPIGLYYLPRMGGPPQKSMVEQAIATTFEYTYGILSASYPNWRGVLFKVLATLDMPGPV